MSIGSIANGEVGFSVRTKLNSVISLVGGAGTTPYNVTSVLFADGSGNITFDTAFTYNSSTEILTVNSITLAADPTISLGAATKQYVDNRVATKITVSSTAPSSPSVNDVWIDTT